MSASLGLSSPSYYHDNIACGLEGGQIHKGFIDSEIDSLEVNVVLRAPRDKAGNCVAGSRYCSVTLTNHGHLSALSKVSEIFRKFAFFCGGEGGGGKGREGGGRGEGMKEGVGERRKNEIREKERGGMK